MPNAPAKIMTDSSTNRYRRVAAKLAEKHERFEQRVDVSMPEIGIFVSHVLALLFPHFIKDNNCGTGCLATRASALHASLVGILDRIPMQGNKDSDQLAEQFIEALPEVLDACIKDMQAVLSFDPAAKSSDEVILAYPGFFAIVVYRLSRVLWLAEIPLLPRLMSEYAHQRTGIDINPGADIGHSFFIDHGTAIVIGETAVIGDSVRIYQGVTIGALRVEKSDAQAKRHPTLMNNVIVYANATILGGDTVVGEGSIIGGNVWLTSSVPSHSRVSYKACNETGVSRLAIEQRQSDGSNGAF